MTAPDPLRRKSLAILREGRCAVVSVICQQESYDIDRVEAHVTSSREQITTPYVVDFWSMNGWWCTCLIFQQDRVCAHIAAVQLVTVGAA